MKNQRHHARHCVGLLLTLTVLVIAVARPLASSTATVSHKQSNSNFTPSASSQENLPSLNRWSSNGPDGGSVTSLAIDRSNPATIYAGAGGGVFKSTNSGESWSPSLSADYNHSTDTLAIDPRITTTLYAGGSFGVSKSTDGGASWHTINNGLANQYGNAYVRALVIDPRTTTTLYVGGQTADNHTGISKSTDGGTSWHTTNNGLPIDEWGNTLSVTALAIDSTNPNIIYALGWLNIPGTFASFSTIYKSADGGANWSQIFNASRVASLFALAIDPLNSNTIYAAGHAYDCCGGVVLKSTNNGGSWSRINLAFGISVLAIDPTNPNVIYAGANISVFGVFKSTNGGQSWGEFNDGLRGHDPYALAIDPAHPRTVYAGSGGGVFKSTNSGTSWSATNNGLRGGVSVGALAVNPGNANVIYADTFKSTDNGGSWAANEFYPLAFDPRNPNTIYATFVTGRVGLSKSTDGGATWSSANTGLEDTYVYTLAIDPSNSAVIYATTDGGAFKSTNAGGSWSQSNTGLDGVYVLAIDPRNSNIVYAGGPSMFKSTNAGGSWSAIGNLIGVGLVQIDPGNSQTVYAVACDSDYCDSSVLYKSTDGGGNWIGIFGNPSSLVIDPTHPNIIYVGTYGDGVYKSIDRGASWKQFNDGLTTLNIYALAMDLSGTFLHAATPAGVFDTQLSSNPIDGAQLFVRQQYLDFLNREPDAGGLAYWTDRITQCGSDARCIHERRIGVSAAFFIELEFQDSGYFVYRCYKASFGRPPNLAEFSSDRSQVVVGADAEAGRQAFAEQWVQRAAFQQAYPMTLSNTEFVNKLFDMAGLTASLYDPQRQQEIAAMDAGRSRALVLRDVIEIPDFKNIPDPNSPRYAEIKRTSQYNPAFVLMQYFGYLRRNVDQGGYDFWLEVLNNRAPNNYQAMVCAFITSTEYQLRFATTVTRTNQDCGQ
jgi:photosystem II stability/assembly factor-like uncharacterized protein